MKKDSFEKDYFINKWAFVSFFKWFYCSVTENDSPILSSSMQVISWLAFFFWNNIYLLWSRKILRTMIVKSSKTRPCFSMSALKGFRNLRGRLNKFNSRKCTTNISFISESFKKSHKNTISLKNSTKTSKKLLKKAPRSWRKTEAYNLSTRWWRKPLGITQNWKKTLTKLSLRRTKITMKWFA